MRHCVMVFRVERFPVAEFGGWGFLAGIMKSRMELTVFSAMLLVGMGSDLVAEGEWNPGGEFPALSPAESIRQMEVPKGYRVECVASEPMVEGPAMIAFDGNGARYVCEWRTYMQD